MLTTIAGKVEARRRRNARRAFRARQDLIRPAYKVWGYKNVFAKGFLVTDRPAAMVRETWQQVRMGNWQVQYDSVLRNDAHGDGDVNVLLLGHAFDDDGRTRGRRITEHILRVVKANASAENQTLALDDLVTWLSGRYVLILRRGERLDVWNDPLASKSVYFHVGSGGPALASHSELLAQVAGGLPSTRVRWVHTHPDYRSPAGKWLPGLITPHDEVGQLYANGRLTVEADRVRHQRFFPRQDRVELAPREASERFARALRQQVRNWLSTSPLTVLTLTAGRDSRAILQAGLVELQEAQAIALTYHTFHAPERSTLDDLTTGNRLAIAAGLQHLPVNVAPVSSRSPFTKLYASTFPTWQRYLSLANALYLQAPAHASTIFGVGGAIITGMYRDTSAPVPTPEVLAQKYAQSKFAKDPELLDEMSRWMEFTNFSADSMYGYDFHDFFHWEHRMTKWGGAGYAEYDLATTPAPVLSSRRLLVAALSLPKPMRVDAMVYRYLNEGQSAFG